MFEGFTQDTFDYLIQMRLNNSKAAYEPLRETYRACVRAPLLSLCEALTPVMTSIDPGLCVRPARCVSGAYNDLRFSQATPIKTYFYLHFMLDTNREQDVPGFFMDANHLDFRYGLRIYHGTPGGCARLRDAAARHERRFVGALDAVPSGVCAVGLPFKRDMIPALTGAAHDAANRRSWEWICSGQAPALLCSPALEGLLADAFIALAPLYRFMKDALA